MKLNLSIDIDDSQLKALIKESLREVLSEDLSTKPPFIDTTPPPVTKPVNPPVEEPIEPPRVEAGVENITQQWLDTISDPNLIEWNLGEGTYQILPIKNIPIRHSLRLIAPSNRATLIFGSPAYDKWSANPAQDGVLFTLEGVARLFADNINFCQPKQAITVEPWRPNIFASRPDINAQWVAAIRNCDTTVLGRHGGMGLGFVYGSNPGNHLAAINYRHCGTNFLDAKTAIGGSKDSILSITLDDVITDGANELEFGTYKIEVRAKIQEGVFTILSEHTTGQMRNYCFTPETLGNYAHIIHLGRFTFMLDPEKVLDSKKILLRPLANGRQHIKVIQGKIYTVGAEGHAGDTFYYMGTTYTIQEKGRDEHPFWSNNYKPKESPISYTPYLIPNPVAIPDGEYWVDWKSSFDQLDVELPAVMLYKESSYGFRSYPSTHFGDHEIMEGGVIGHSMYNHASITLWARDVIQRGYYRQTNPGGKSLGYNMVRCEGFGQQFNPPVPVTSDPNLAMPAAILNLLA